MKLLQVNKVLFIILAVLLTVLAIVFPLCLLGTVFCIFIAYKMNKSQKAYKNDVADKGALFLRSYKHIYGLPIGENAVCKLYAFDNKLEITSGANDFIINKSQITDAQITNTVEVSKYKNSSIGGAVGSAMIAGPLGAVIGGRAKTKTSRSITYFLIFAYNNKDGELNNIGFELGELAGDANKFVKLFRPTATNAAIEL